jgi:hypothetical protein
MRAKLSKLTVLTFAASLCAAGFSAGLANAQSAPVSATVAAPADGPIATGHDQAAPKPPASDDPATIQPAAPEDGPLNFLASHGVHGQVGSMFDSRGGHAYWGNVSMPIGDNGYADIAISQSKLRW